LIVTGVQTCALPILALVRVSASDPAHRNPADPPADPCLRSRVLESLARLDWDKLDDAGRIGLLRVHQVLFNRFGRPEEPERQAVDRKSVVEGKGGDR